MSESPSVVLVHGAWADDSSRSAVSHPAYVVKLIELVAGLGS